MSRARSLKEEANAIFKMNKTGTYQKRLKRRQVIYKFIDTLSAIKEVPLNWMGLKKEHVIKVINYWRKNKLANDSVRRYVGEIRYFLKVIGYDVKDIDNKSLNIKRTDDIKKVEYHDDYLQKISDKKVYLLLSLQTEFGLTLSEAFRFSPSLHIRDTLILLSRDITNNSEDRVINIITENQKKVVGMAFSIIDENINLIQQYGYTLLREFYRREMIKIKLTPSVNYRHVYAKKRLIELTASDSKKKSLELILNEMGVESRTLRKYLNE